MKKQLKKRNYPDGMKPFWSYIPEELMAKLDARLDKKKGDLRPIYRSRPEVFAKAIELFLAAHEPSNVPGSSELPANQ